MMNFETQLKNLKKLDLPLSQYAVVGSGPLAVRGIRDSKDVDVIVTNSLWAELVTRHKSTFNDKGIETLCLENAIEILNPLHSVFGDGNIIPLDDIFEKADIFDGIKFINLVQLKEIKLKIGREKDLQDIDSINQYLRILK